MNEDRNKEMHQLINQLANDAARWRKLMRLCGSLKDGSQSTVILWQDDATGSAGIKIDKQVYTGDRYSFETIIDNLIPDPID